jgi:hypothetical protein
MKFKAGVIMALAALFTGVSQSDGGSIAVDEDAPWPRVRSTNDHTVTSYQPQVERWTTYSFSARSAVEVKLSKASKALMGVVWFDAHGSVDRSNRIVTLDELKVSKARFPEATDNGSNALAAVREVLPGGVRTVSLDYLITALGFDRAAARQGTHGLKHNPPEIIWATNYTTLVIIDGEPVLKPLTNSTLRRVVNTPVMLVYDSASTAFYLAGGQHWFSAATINGPWSLSQTPHAAVSALAANPNEKDAETAPESIPSIIVRTRPAELLMTSGLPDYRPIRGTALQYAADTDSQLFFHNGERLAYLLLSGRWYKASSLNGPWDYVAPHDLPADFAKIPANTPQGIVLASVPDTPQAQLAMLANSAPTIATVSRSNASIKLTYDGEPQFKPIEGTSLSYAVNAQLPVVLASGNYFALDNGVWFTSLAATGPWNVASEVPEEVYTIPPSSPIYYATYANVYNASEDEVEVGYTSGYQGVYEDDGTVVYGTGWDYDSWYGDYYYGWGWTWGYSYVYVPWYGWWCWRPWWNQPGGLRAALIENVYDRWQGRNGVSHHNRAAASAAGLGSAAFSGYPAVYGRFRGATGTERMTPPAQTLALNPYSRPTSAIRPGDVPHGAQLLRSVHQNANSGRDLYASPDGNVYLRKNDGWYRREAGGNWNRFAAIQSQVQKGVTEAPLAAQAPGARAELRQSSSRNADATPRNIPNVGGEARSEQVAALEREYYARSLADARAQYWRSGGAGNFSGRARRGGGRRR